MLSRWYSFYPAWEDENGEVTPLLMLTNGSPACIFERSASFIEHEVFDNLPMMQSNEFNIICEDYFAHRYDDITIDKNKNFTWTYKLTEEWLSEIGESRGVVSGYVPIDEAMEYYKQEYPQDYFYWSMSTPISAEAFLSLPKDKQLNYVKITHLDTYSASYICNLLLEVLDDIYVPWEKKGRKVILLRYSF